MGDLTEGLTDPVYRMIGVLPWLTLEQEKRRQKHFINLIPSENFTSQAVLDALGSVMQSGCLQRLGSLHNLTQVR